MKKLTKENILLYTNNGWDVYKHYCQKLRIEFQIGKNINNPFYNDTKAGLNFYYKSNKILFNDFGETKYSGDVFKFVAFYYNLDIKENFIELLSKINSDLNLNLEEVSQSNNQIDYKSITKTAPKYFAEYSISPEVLRACNVVEVNWFKTKKGNKITSKPQNPIFAYKIDENTFKIYQPLNLKFKFSWIGTKPKDYHFGLIKTDNTSKYLIIAAGEKDAMVLQSLGYMAICLNSETEMNLSEEFIDKLNQQSDSIFVLYDNDDTGQKCSAELAEKYNFVSIHLPDTNILFGKDVSDYMKFANSNEGHSEINKENLIFHIKNQIKKYRTTDSQTIDEEVYEYLPQLIVDIIQPYSDIKRQRDIIFIATIVLLGSVISEKVYGIYDGKEVHPNLYFFVMGSPASGKGAINDLRYLLDDINKHLKDKNNDSELENKNDRLIPRSLLIPANTSFSGILKLLYLNKSNGLILESEADVLNAMFKTDFGDYSTTLRQAFHHEKVTIYRKTDNEHSNLEVPKLSILLTGTPRQLQNFIRNTEDGLFSRFIYFTLITENEFKDVFERKDSINEYFSEFSRQLLNIYRYLEDSQKVRFSLTQKQEKIFLEEFKKYNETFEKDEGESILQYVRRMGLITFRIIMTLTFIEKWENKNIEPTIVASDITFEKAMKLAKYCLQQVRITISYLKLEATNILPTLMQDFYKRLPNEFKTKVANEIGAKIGLHPKKIERFLVDEKLFLKVSKGYYRKIKSEDKSK